MRVTLTMCLLSAVCVLAVGLSACGEPRATDAHNQIKPIAANEHVTSPTQDPVKDAQHGTLSKPNQSTTQSASRSRCDNRVIFTQHQQQNPTRKTQALGCGQIIKVLPDDKDGSRHQRLLVRLDNYPQITVLIAHNIDLAPRVDGVKAKQPIRFYGEYIYNAKGGVVHWTHKDPSARHQDGWLDYQGKRYW